MPQLIREHLSLIWFNKRLFFFLLQFDFLIQFKQIEILIANNCWLSLLKKAQWLKMMLDMNIHQNLFQWPIKTRQKNLSFWLDVILNPIQILFTGSNLHVNQTYVFRLQDLNTPSLCIYPSPWQPLGQRRLIELVLDKVLEKKKIKKQEHD